MTLVRIASRRGYGNTCHVAASSQRSRVRILESGKWHVSKEVNIKHNQTTRKRTSGILRKEQHKFRGEENQNTFLYHFIPVRIDVPKSELIEASLKGWPGSHTHATSEVKSSSFLCTCTGSRHLCRTSICHVAMSQLTTNSVAKQPSAFKSKR